MWIPRSADHALATALADGGPRLVTVFGLGGAGSSATVARAVGRGALRVDLVDVTSPHQAEARLSRAHARVVFLDQVHCPETVRKAAESLSRRTRVVVAARRPLGSDEEQRIPLAPIPPPDMTAFVSAEVRRHGLSGPRRVDEIVHHADGWLLSARALVLEARLGAAREIDATRLHARAPDVGRVLQSAWDDLDGRGQSLLVALTSAREGLDAADVLGLVPDATTALARLVDAGLVVAERGIVRVLRPVAELVFSRENGGALRAARARGDALVLATAARARDAHRRDPAASTLVLERLHADLARIARSAAPRRAVEATLCLEPVLVAALSRSEALTIFQRATQLARRLDVDARARAALALVRTYIHRGEHESAAELLGTTPELAKHPVHAVHRAIYLGHVAAWRGRLDEATASLDEADARIAAALRRGGSAEDRHRFALLEEDVLVQRAFVALERGELDEADRLARACAVAATREPSPRLGTLARRFAGEILLRKGDAAAAVPLFERTRDELLSFGDRAGWLFAWSRMVEAMRAAGDPRAAHEARVVRELAARAGEGVLELAVLGSLDEADVERVVDLGWRAQIPRLRDEAARWVAARGPRGVPPILRLDPPTKRATLDERSASLARRPSLWRVLVALADAHSRGLALSFENLFEAGWPGERAEVVSQRKRVQTAVWTLRRVLLGDLLGTHPEGYALDPTLRLSRES